MHYFFEGKYHEEDQEFSLNHRNRALSYGDGFFETLISFKNQVRFWQSHFSRIQNALEALELENCFAEEYLLNIINELIQLENSEWCRCKIIIWRKEGGLYTPTNNQIDFLISCEEFVESSSKLEKVDFLGEVGLCYSPFSRYKTLNALPYILAGLQKTKLQVNDLILLNHANQVTETISANIFWIKNNQLYTSDLRTGCIEGIVRNEILKISDKKGWKVTEGFYFEKDILEAETVFTSNVSGLKLISNIKGISFDSNYIFNEITQELFPYSSN